MSKIFERIKYRRLLSFCDMYGIISSNQYGFRKERSTADAILNFVEGGIAALNNKKNLVSIFLDFSRAFDTVNHSILLNE